MKKSELRQMIREVLKEELSKKKSLTESATNLFYAVYEHYEEYDRIDINLEFISHSSTAAKIKYDAEIDNFYEAGQDDYGALRIIAIEVTKADAAILDKVVEKYYEYDDAFRSNWADATAILKRYVDIGRFKILDEIGTTK